MLLQPAHRSLAALPRQPAQVEVIAEQERDSECQPEVDFALVQRIVGARDPLGVLKIIVVAEPDRVALGIAGGIEPFCRAQMLLHQRQPAVAIKGDSPSLQPGVECDAVARAWQRAALSAIMLVGELIEHIGGEEVHFGQALIDQCMQQRNRLGLG